MSASSCGPENGSTATDSREGRKGASLQAKYATAPARTTPANAAATRAHARIFFDAGSTTAFDRDARSARSASSTSAAFWNRCSGSFFRHRSITADTPAGISVAKPWIGCGSLSRTAASVASSVSLANARRPLAISYSRQPKAKMSERASTGCPLICSGLMYEGEPTSRPSRVMVVGVAAFSDATTDAMPKSKIFGPIGVSITFAGFRSRCTTPARCMYARPLRTAVATEISS